MIKSSGIVESTNKNYVMSEVTDIEIGDYEEELEIGKTLTRVTFYRAKKKLMEEER